MDSAEKNVLFCRLSAVFSISPSKLEDIFIHYTDGQFDNVLKLLQPPSISYESDSRNVSMLGTFRNSINRKGQSGDNSIDQRDSLSLLSCESSEFSATVNPGPRREESGSSSFGVNSRTQGNDSQRSVDLSAYCRPTLPPPLPPDHPRSAEYYDSMAKILMHAITNTDVYLVQHVIVEAPSVLSQLKPEDIGALLFMGVSCDVLNVVLKQGVDPNTLDKYGSTLLHICVSEKKIAIIKLLLSYKADCNIEDTRNQRSALQLAALQGDFDILYELVCNSKVPVKLDRPDFDGNSLLHLVLQSEFPSAQYKTGAMFLMDRGLSPSAKNLCGETPIHYFCGNRSLSENIPVIEPLFELLLEKLVTVNLRDNEDCTPLIIACAHRNWDLCKIMIRNGADMNIPCSMSCRLLKRGCDMSRSSDSDVLDADCTTGDLLPRSMRKKIFPCIAAAQSLIDPESRDRCMNCAALFSAIKTSGFILFASNPKSNCRNCGRVVCPDCIVDSELPFAVLPQYLKDVSDPGGYVKACVICHPILSKDVRISKFWY